MGPWGALEPVITFQNPWIPFLLHKPGRPNPWIPLLLHKPGRPTASVLSESLENWSILRAWKYCLDSGNCAGACRHGHAFTGSGPHQQDSPSAPGREAELRKCQLSSLLPVMGIGRVKPFTVSVSPQSPTRHDSESHGRVLQGYRASASLCTQGRGLKVDTG